MGASITRVLKTFRLGLVSKGQEDRVSAGGATRPHLPDLYGPCAFVLAISA